jgi:hypothetical protein
MTPAERERVEEDLNDALAAAIDEERASLPPDALELMAEGDEHQELWIDAKHTLRRHFGRTRRSLYVAANLPVHYPGERSFAPDLLAVVDAPTRKRRSWMVLREGKGIDLCLEICVYGRRRKDRVDNVLRYARLGIREYFLLDVGRHQLRGYRLAGPGARTYERVVPNHGRFVSEVLGLEIGYREGRLRFYAGSAVLLTPEEESDDLARLAEEIQQRADAEQQRADTEQQRADQAIALAVESLLQVLELRGLALPEPLLQRIQGCREPQLLERWLRRARSARSADELLLDD